jgi:hypothetical protein
VPTKNCPFYGRALSFSSVNSFVLLERHDSDQCALITRRVEPCALEAEGKPADWSVCPVLQLITRGKNRKAIA